MIVTAGSERNPKKKKKSGKLARATGLEPAASVLHNEIVRTAYTMPHLFWNECATVWTCGLRASSQRKRVLTIRVCLLDPSLASGCPSYGLVHCRAHLRGSMMIHDESRTPLAG
jgi:hypothetical protein